MEAILEMSRADYGEDFSIADASKETIQPQPSYLRKHEMNARVSALDVELNGIDEQIEQLKVVRQTLLREKQDILRQSETMSNARTTGSKTVNGKGKARASETINYTIVFDWDAQLKGTMKKVFGIANFRLCQQG